MASHQASGSCLPISISSGSEHSDSQSEDDVDSNSIQEIRPERRVTEVRKRPGPLYPDAG